jgi:hypothetical protein
MLGGVYAMIVKREKSGKLIYIPSFQKTNQSIISAKSNYVSNSSVLQADLTARQWLAGLIQGVWQGGNTWLTLEVGTGVNTTESVPSHLGAPQLRKLVDSVNFTLSDGQTLTPGPSTTIQIAASLQTPDLNGQTITEYAIYGGGLNLNQAPFGTGLLIIYQAITAFPKTSSEVLSFDITVNT